jgi:hypothetical protein
MNNFLKSTVKPPKTGPPFKLQIFILSLTPKLYHVN